MSIIYINPYQFAAAGPTDPDFANVSLLLHGDGTNGSTTIIDSSPSPKTVTAVGDAQISTAQSKFGGSSIYFDGNGDYLGAPHSTDFDFGTGDFTVEFWMFRAGNSTGGVPTDYEALIGSNTASGNVWWTIYLQRSTKNIIFYGNDAVLRIASGETISDNSWYHIAWCRQGTVLTGYINGTARYSNSSVGGNFFTHPIHGLRVGHDIDANRQFFGYIDDLRITRGVARYVSNFTPPTAPFPDA